MSTPVLWIFFPMVVGLILFFLRRWYRTTVLIGSITVITLAIGAVVLPINEFIRLGPVTFKVNESMTILGRQLILGIQDRPLVIQIYILAAFWFCAAFEARAGRMFVPIGLVLVSLWVSALAVEPFLFAALLLEIAVLLSIPLISPPGTPPGRGVIRYVVLQTFGMPFILMTGWLLTGVESSPGDLDLIRRATASLGFGFLFLLSIFPFHSWIPMIAEEAHPYTASFIFFFQPLMVTLFGLYFLNQYAWLRQSTELFNILRLSGILMVVVGGVGAALQNHMGRILGFAVLIATGTMLLAISASPSLDLFFAMLLPRALSFAVWSLALSIIQRGVVNPATVTTELGVINPAPVSGITSREALTFHNVHGIGRRLPIAMAATTLAALSLAGYPILSNFPVYQALYRDLATTTPLIASMTLLGSLFLGAGVLRSFLTLVTGKDEQPWQVAEHRMTAIFLFLGTILIILLGLFPQWVLPYAATISRIYDQLSSSPLLP
jgi:formate hydrogenlyase subunit 3/multisubunit Na+/H+ antiporter MnhD subunit